MKLTIAIGASKGFWNHVRLALGTIPASIPIVLSWYGPGEPGHLPDNVRLVRPAEHTNNFRRGYVLNVAIRSIETEYVLLADADMLYPSMLFDCLEFQPDQVLRFYVGRLTDSASQDVRDGAAWESLFADYQGTDYQGRENAVFYQVFGAHNPCLYPVTALNQLRGYDERMIGWGAEDDDLTIRSRRAGLRDKRLPIVVADLHHENSPDYPNTYDRGHTSRNNIGILQDQGRPVAVNYDGWGDGD